MVNFGPLSAEIISLVWGTPGNFNWFRVLAALLHGTLVVGVSQTAALNRGRHRYSAGRPSRWILAHILVWSKSDQRRLRKTLHKQTDKQTDRHYENNGHLAVNQKHGEYAWPPEVSAYARRQKSIRTECIVSHYADKAMQNDVTVSLL